VRPRLGGDVLGRIRCQDVQVTQQRGLTVVPQRGEGSLIALLGRGEDGREVLSDHGARAS
jgi:hypothetical protein